MRLDSIHESDGAYDHMIENAVKAASRPNVSSGPPPWSGRSAVRGRRTSAAATRPAPASIIPIRTSVVRSSRRPPAATNDAAATASATRLATAAFPARCGSGIVTVRRDCGRLSGPAREDTSDRGPEHADGRGGVPARERRQGSQRRRSEQGEQDDQGGREVVAEPAGGPGGHARAGDLHRGLVRARGVVERLAVGVGRRGEQLSAATATSAAGGASGAAGGAAAACRRRPSCRLRRGSAAPA